MRKYGKKIQELESPDENNLLHQLTHLIHFIDLYNIAPSQLNSIVEYGGGFGAMRFLFYLLGFKGKYTIIDFPELIEIQKNYLGEIETEWQEHYNVPECDLFLGMFSISEAPTSQRIPLNDIPAHYLFFAYQLEQDGVNNVDWFKQNVDKWEIVDFEIPHLRPNRYLLGKKKV